MKKFTNIYYLRIAIVFISFFIINLFVSCSTSVIKVDAKTDDNGFIMYGKNSARDFYLPMEIGDSLLLKWESEINGSFNNTSVTVYDSFVFSNDLSGRIYCFNINSGKVVGQLKHKGAVYTTPIINDFKVIYAVAQNESNKSLITSYDYKKGEIFFEKEVDGLIRSQPVQYNEEIIFITENGKVYSFNLLGEKLWEKDIKKFTHSSPALSGNILVFGNDKGEIIGMNPKNGEIIYQKTIAESFLSGCSIKENIIYIGSNDGNLYVIDADNGELIWKFNTGSRIEMTPVIFEDRIFIANLSGKTYLLEKKSGKIIWEKEINGILNATPLVTKNYIIIPDLSLKYHFINLKNGEVIKTIQLDARAKMTPVYEKNLLFIGYDHGRIRAYEILN